jgi:nitrate/TMAO reductase-like tetraheme cytochrome c subunit
MCKQRGRLSDFIPQGLAALVLVFGTSSATSVRSAEAPLAGQKSAGVTNAPAKIDDTLFFPSAKICKQCHPQQYNEWTSSSHAYASISPMFHKFEQRITDLASGTVGTFCVRCHASVGTALHEDRALPLWDRSPVSREGVTCVTCHRVSAQYGKVNGERRIVEGDISQPVFAGEGVCLLETVLTNAAFYKVRTNPNERGQGIHLKVEKNPQMNQSEFCVSCHQVAVQPGIKLEVVWDQYRASPAFRKGTTCQDCHMGKVPGVAGEYATGPAATVDGKPVNPTRKHANHAFAGPGYSIAHPGIFPHNSEAEQFPIQAWLKFDYLAGWGTPEFEEQVSNNKIKVDFPKEWDSSIDREEARRILNDNVTRLREKLELRRQVMENGSRLDGPFFRGSRGVGKALKFEYKVSNINPGHNLPSGSLGAQPEIWLNVALIDPDGSTVWESGYLDSNGDMCDVHSLEVAAGRSKYDHQLFNLQSKFLTTNVKGTDREMYLPVNLDIDQLPYIRPDTRANSVMNHPPFIRMEAHSLPPLGHRMARYSVPGKLISKPGKYKLAVRLRSRAEPIYFMKFCNSTREMELEMNRWMLDIHPYTVEFEIK